MAESRQLTNFYVTTRVDSDGYTDISQIDDKTSKPTHIIEVENTTTVRRDAQPVGFLPSGTNNIAFNEGAGQTDKWSRDHTDMLPKEIRSAQCPLEHVQAALVSQLIRVQEVNTKRANGNWVPEKSVNLPFGIQIDIK